MAYDFSFDHKNLARELKLDDFNLRRIPSKAHKEAIVARAVEEAASNLALMPLDEHVGKKTTTYQMALMSQELVLRKLNRNLKYLTKVRQSDREAIITSLRELFEEGHAYKVYRLDIASFYESVDMSELKKLVASDNSLSRTTINVFNGFVDALARRGISGLPRGLSISATLAELYLRKFDYWVKRNNNVYYYARFVDDIIVVTTEDSGGSSFMKELYSALPPGLMLNGRKTKIYTLHGEAKRVPSLSAEVDFLGYKFRIHEIKKGGSDEKRTVSLDISDRKVDRFKSRLCKSLIDFGINRDYNLLQIRFSVLCSNYNLYDRSKGINRNVGIYYNYRFIDGSISTSLVEMDRFIRYSLSCTTARTHQGASRLTNKQKRALMSKLPSKSYSRKTFHYISADNLISAVGCWKHD